MKHPRGPALHGQGQGFQGLLDPRRRRSGTLLRPEACVGGGPAGAVPVRDAEGNAALRRRGADPSVAFDTRGGAYYRSGVYGYAVPERCSDEIR